MKCLLIGNGFDLHHKFPTRYIDFLQTVQFLMEKEGTVFDTVGSVLGNGELQKRNFFIKECYNQHFITYVYTSLSSEQLHKLVSEAKKNIWFRYLYKCVKNDIGWIDFEKEIDKVVDVFVKFFSADCDVVVDTTAEDHTILIDISSCLENPGDRDIFDCFSFFIGEGTWRQRKYYNQINKKYVRKRLASWMTRTIEIMDVDLIVNDLYDSLRELADMLKTYLRLFVDAPSRKYAQDQTKPVFWSADFDPGEVYSFNYTNTVRLLYGDDKVMHIHGNTATDIVLGINPDKSDEIEQVDTTFLQFKKYFQRIFYKTDIDYLKKITDSHYFEAKKPVELSVIGHSLDVTDEDIIKQIFGAADKITIYYHSSAAVKSMIKNLVEIYGKKGLDMLREKKELAFLPQSDIQWKPVEAFRNLFHYEEPQCI